MDTFTAVALAILLAFIGEPARAESCPTDDVGGKNLGASRRRDERDHQKSQRSAQALAHRRLFIA
jgi:hypothetical protein